MLSQLQFPLEQDFILTLSVGVYSRSQNVSVDRITFFKWSAKDCWTATLTSAIVK